MKPVLPLFLLASTTYLVFHTAGCGPTDKNRSVSEKANTALPDNTARNARDLDDATLTAGDQGKSLADRELTQKIRKALVIDANGYSLTAKNIKIITLEGKVTLRGPVNSAAERTSLAALAGSFAGPANVDDQLEVIP